jgi:c-di-GMP-binding flagellar brake protein YcgR
MNVRLHFRVQPKLDSGLALHYRGKKVNLLDISLGGARFSLDKSEELELDDPIRLELKIDQKMFDVEASVVRSWLSTLAGRMKKVQFVAVKFLLDNADLEQLLANKMMAVQRQLLADAKLRR